MMKSIERICFSIALTLLWASFCWAQDTPATQTNPQSDTANPATQADPQMSPSASTGSGSIQGCLSGSSGNYMLAQDGTGAMYRLIGNENRLKSHVGHEIMVTGEMSGSGSTASNDQSSNDATASSPASGGGTIQVSEVKMVSKHCSSGKGAQPMQ